MKIQYLLIIFVILIIYFIWKIFISNEMIKVRATFDNNEYIIRGGQDKSQNELLESANTLAIINQKVNKLIVHLVEKYRDDPDKNYWIRHFKNNYTSDVLSEAAHDRRYTTFTIDKKDMHVCLRTRDNNRNLYDINLLFYVILHELAHFCNYTKYGTPIEGHGKEFKEKFILLVKESIDLGLYKYENYNYSPKEYCGMVINTHIIN